MGERVSVVSIQARFDTGEALDGVRSLKDGLTGLGETAPAVEGVGAAIGSVAPAASEAAGATDRLDAAVAKLDAASGRGLLRAITQAKVEVAGLEEQLAALGGPGAAGAAEIEAAIDRANASVQTGIGRLAVYREELRATNEQVKLGVATHAAFGSSLGGVGTAVAGMTTKFGQLALAGAGLTLALEGPKMYFETIKSTAESLEKGLRALGVPVDELADKVVALGSKMVIGGDAADHWGVHMAGGLAAAGQARGAIADLDEELTKLGLHLKDPQVEMRIWGQEAVELDKRLAEMKISGESVDSMLKANSDTFYKWASAIDKSTVDVSKFPPAVQQLIAKVLSSGEAFDKAKAAQDRFTDSIAKSADKITLDYAKEMNSADAAASAAQRKADTALKALNEQGAGDASYAEKKKAIEDDLTSALQAASAKRVDATKKEEDAAAELDRKAKDHGTTVAAELKNQDAYNKAIDASAKAQGDAVTTADVLKGSVDGLGGVIADATTPAERLAAAAAKLPEPAGHSAVALAALKEVLPGLNATLGPFGVGVDNAAKKTLSLNLATKDAAPHLVPMVSPMAAAALGAADLGKNLTGVPEKVKALGDALAPAAVSLGALAAAQERYNRAMQGGTGG